MSGSLKVDNVNPSTVPQVGPAGKAGKSKLEGTLRGDLVSVISGVRAPLTSFELASEVKKKRPGKTAPVPAAAHPTGLNWLNPSSYCTREFQEDLFENVQLTLDAVAASDLTEADKLCMERMQKYLDDAMKKLETER